jgi:hypothetical protein
MEEADFQGRLHLIDDFTTFDNERWAVIRSESTGLESVTSTELGVMADVLGVFGDEEFFQVYDNLAKFTEKYVAAGLRWNYFYHNWKTISTSPFADMIVFVKSTASLGTPTAVVYKVASVDTDATGNKVKESSYDWVKRTDMGFKVGCGLEYNMLYAEAGYQFGVTDIAKDNPTDDAAHTGNVFINIGVNF